MLTFYRVYLSSFHYKLAPEFYLKVYRARSKDRNTFEYSFLLVSSRVFIKKINKLSIQFLCGMAATSVSCEPSSKRVSDELLLYLSQLPFYKIVIAFSRNILFRAKLTLSRTSDEFLWNLFSLSFYEILMSTIVTTFCVWVTYEWSFWWVFVKFIWVRFL